MSDDRFPTAEEKGKNNCLKKFAAPFAVASACGAAALLFASGKTDSALSSMQLQTNFLSLSNDTAHDLSKGENCSSSFERLWEENNSNFIGSHNMTSHLHDGMYRDPSFPANKSSLYWDMQTSQSTVSQKKTYKQIEAETGGLVWLRPYEVQAKLKLKPPSLYGPKGVQVRTSEQKALGDCWFLSSATAIAETPSRIHEIFNGVKEYNPNGAFQMFFYVRGEKVAVHIDDRIGFAKFTNAQKGKAGFGWLNNAPSQDGAWWLVLLEKAFAKLNVNYANINGGEPGEALRALTGAPVVNYSSKDLVDNNDLLWKVVTEGMNKNYPMVAGTHQQNSAFDVVDGHAETCLGSLILKNQDGTEHVKLIKMRNPWGRYKYDGPWSNQSDLWTPEFKKQADFAEADGGIFYTPLENWTSEFKHLTVAHTGEWKVDSIEGISSTFTSNTTSSWIVENVFVKNPIKQDVFVECNQYTSRLWPFTDDKQCHGEEGHPQTYFAEILYSQNNKDLSHTIECNGDSLLLRDVAPGVILIDVNNMGLKKKGNSIWALRTYAQTVAAPLHHNL